jgi:hypothetical protein
LLLQATEPITIDRTWKSSVGSVVGTIGGILIVLVVLTAFGYLAECAEPDDGC